MNWKKHTLLIAIIAMIFLIALYTKQYLYGAHRDIATEETTMELSAQALATEFISNQEEASKTFLDKVITVYGKKTAQESMSIVLADQVQANLLNDHPIDFSKGEVLYLKGRIIGYDELLEMVKIDQATQIIKK